MFTMGAIIKDRKYRQGIVEEPYVCPNDLVCFLYLYICHLPAFLKIVHQNTKVLLPPSLSPVN